jgi:hypothetical protein
MVLTRATAWSVIAAAGGATAAAFGCRELIERSPWADTTVAANKWIMLGAVSAVSLVMGTLAWMAAGSLARRRPVNVLGAVLIMAGAVGTAAAAMLGVGSVPQSMAPRVFKKIHSPELKAATNVDPLPDWRGVFQVEQGFPLLDRIAQDGLTLLSLFFGELTDGAVASRGPAVVPELEMKQFIPYLHYLDPLFKADHYQMTPKGSDGSIRLMVPLELQSEGDSRKGAILKTSSRMLALYRDRIGGEPTDDHLMGRFVNAYARLAASIKIETEPDKETTESATDVVKWMQLIDDGRRPVLSPDDWIRKSPAFTLAIPRMRVTAQTQWGKGYALIRTAWTAARNRRDLALLAAAIDTRLTADLVGYYAYAAKAGDFWSTDLKPIYQEFKSAIDKIGTENDEDEGNSPDQKKKAAAAKADEPAHALRRLSAAFANSLKSDKNDGPPPRVNAQSWDPYSLLLTVRDYLGMETWGNPSIEIPGVGTKGINDAIEQEFKGTFLVGYPDAQVNPRTHNRAQATTVAFAIVAKYLKPIVTQLINRWVPRADAARKLFPKPEPPADLAGAPAMSRENRRKQTICEPFQWEQWFDRMDVCESLVKGAGFDAKFLKSDVRSQTVYYYAGFEQIAMCDSYIGLLRKAASEMENLVAGGLTGLVQGSHWYTLFETGGSGGGINPFSILFKLAQGLPLDLPPKRPDGSRDWDKVKPDTKRVGGLTDISVKGIKELLAKAEQAPPKIAETDVAAAESSEGAGTVGIDEKLGK